MVIERTSLTYNQILVLEALLYEPRVRNQHKLIANLLERGHNELQMRETVKSLIELDLIRLIPGSEDGLQNPADYLKDLLV
jgi:DNA-binding MarR family transcriptional regulator